METESKVSVEETDDGAKKTAKAIFDYVEMLAFAVATVLILFTMFFRISVVSGNSMFSTLKNGDKLVISNILYTPKAGDIVVFENVNYTKTGEPLIKRVIATGGQYIRLGNDGSVYVYQNAEDTAGTKLQEDYISLAVIGDDGTVFGEQSNYYLSAEYLSLYDKYKEKTLIPEGYIFVLGDHRNSSLDSRYFGMVDERLILGRVLFRISPFNQIGAVD